ncbi:response regulator transcription factor [Paenibacillus glycinis]|uniref:Response regulator n=1 Tax=Paenibacillus glycinis TaxID=2697035 RepID=A0ABW9XNE0_9BACL|nr:response regulator transcription factor [Paenibacillus glycinis]NBD24145.1 response regulator [Paenibacillus glycinis]
MYKVMIVDDEWLVRQGLRQTIPWREMGCEVVAEALDGEEALALATLHEPDIVLTDIRMPRMDGLELARRIKRTHPEIKTIFLTGFDDFHYARQALQTGAFDIVLKPTDPAEIRRILQAAMASIAEDRSRSSYTLNLERRVRTSEPLLTEKIFFDLLMNRADKESLQLLLDVRGNGPSAFDSFRVVLFKTPGTGAPRGTAGTTGTAEAGEPAGARESEDAAGPEAQSAFAALKDRLLEAALTPFIPLGQEINAVVVSAAGAEELAAAPGTLPAEVPSLSLSSVHRGLQSVATAYEEASFAMRFNFGLGRGPVVRYEAIVAEAQSHHPAEWSETEVLGMIKWDNAAAIRAKTRSWHMTLLRQSAGSETALRHQMLQLMFGLYALLMRHFWELGCLPDTKSFLESASRADSPETMLRWIEAVCCEVQAAYLLSKQQGKTEFDNVMDYINGHFHKELSMHDLASGLHMSESHFSRIFKKKIGKNFLEYITDLRMEKARDMLLHSDLRVYEVSLAVGYQDARYFSQLFRKVTGETPSDYRQSFSYQA